VSSATAWRPQSATAPSTWRCSSTASRDLNRRARGSWRCCVPQGGDRELSRRRGRGARSRQQSEDPPPAPAGFPSAGSSTSSAEDFHGGAPSKFFRLAPGRESGCATPTSSSASGREGSVSGEVVELALKLRSRDAERSARAAQGEGDAALVSARHAVTAEVRLYDRLFAVENPMREGRRLADDAQSEALTTLSDCQVEPSLAAAAVGERFQFERQGYFCIDPDATADGSSSIARSRSVTRGEDSGRPGGAENHVLRRGAAARPLACCVGSLAASNRPPVAMEVLADPNAG